jgi:hypothetical protein
VSSKEERCEHTVSKLSLYDVEWQCLRVSLLAKYRPDGGWATVKGTSHNLADLEVYVGGVHPTDVTKVWRVLNLLAAVLLGYGSKKIECARLVRRYHRELGKVYHDLLIAGKQLEVPSVAAIKRSLKAAPREEVERVYLDLHNRWEQHKESPHRKELRWFLDLVEQYLTGKG